jgi:L-lactate dehydrogenase complex protein LldE
MSRNTNEVQLFPTCLAEGFFPSIPNAVETVLRRLSVKVRRLRGSFCCGQVAFNDGLREPALNLARTFLSACEVGTPVILPSGSCSSMVRIFYSDLLASVPDLAAKARALQPWLFEFSEFLVDVLKVTDLGARFDHRVAYHPSCHLLRELKIRDQPMRLLAAVRDLKLCALKNCEECCGFGGLFSVKFPHISAAMLDDKIKAIVSSGAEVVTSNDGGCLMQIGGGLSRLANPIAIRHLAEILAST